MSQISIVSTKQSTPVGVLRSIATITGTRDRDLLAISLVSTLSELIHCNNITIYRILPADQGIEAILVAQSAGAATMQKTSFLISEHPDFQEVFESGKEIIKQLEGDACLSIYPITDKQHTVGLLDIATNSHSDLDRHLIMSFLLVYTNYLSLLNESETDTLTGLLNRRTFENNLERIILEQAAICAPSSEQLNPDQRASNKNLPHWLAVMDIDHFKRINDEFGHLYGDEVLLLLSRIMKRVFRQSDKLFRFGGEEFIVVLDRTNLANAKNVLGRFRTAIEDYHFPQVGCVKISIGFVMLDKPDVPSSIVGRADQALYYAKEHGRNQVCFYGDLIKEGKLVVENFSDDVELF